MRNAMIAITMILSGLILSSFMFTEEVTTSEINTLPGAIIFEIPYTDGGPLCNGEIGSVSGTWQFVVNQTVDANGGIHYIEHWNIEASGTGTFGNKYMLKHNEPFAINIAEDGFPFTRTLPFNFQVIGQGRAPNLQSRGIIHITYNANGDISAYVQKTTGLTCKYNEK